MHLLQRASYGGAGDYTQELTERHPWISATLEWMSPVSKCTLTAAQ